MQHTQAKVHALKRCLSNSSAPCKGKVTGTITVHRVCIGQDNEILFDMRDKAVQRTAAMNPIACCAATHIHFSVTSDINRCKNHSRE